jgi:hypothetical protein
MTEAEWLASDSPIPMLQWLAPRYRTKGRYRYRTALLFCLACFERIATHRENSETWILRRAEELADGISDPEPHITQAHVHGVERTRLRHLRLLMEPEGRLAVYAVANEAAGIIAVRQLPRSSERVERAYREEQATQAAVLRDIIGNPFCPVTFEPAWRTTDVLLLARGIYDERAFDRMPILADALQDAGCDNENILAHCRDASATHVRGCWVVDLVLGKE